MNRARSEIILVEDSGWEALRPLTWLRPASELFVGGLTHVERWERITGSRPLVLCRREITRLGQGRIATTPKDRRPRLWIRDRLIPGTRIASTFLDGTEPTAWTIEGRVVAVRTDQVPSGGTVSGDSLWAELSDRLAGHALESSSCLEELSDLIAESGRRIDTDLEDALAEPGVTSCIGDATAYAPERIAVGEGCRIDSGVVLDAREGPIVIGARTEILPNSWIRGPFGCREGCVLLGGRIGGGSYLGPHCRVRGEVEASTFHGFVNKAHDGFVGHSYLGEWVNLGALTTTSDLKNNYGMIRYEAYGRRIDTQQRKIGSFIGDHAKSRIGTMLNSGTVVGVAANLVGEVSVFPKWIPDFVWGIGPIAEVYEWDRCLETVRIVLSRRGKSCSDALQEALKVAYGRSKPNRSSFLASQNPNRGEPDPSC